MNINILNAIMNLVNDPIIDVKEYSDSRNRANSMGVALEEYIKDMFAGTITTTDTKERMKRFSEVFSYSGNQNNPPDFMIRNGDAVEVKKIEGMGSSLALNSSYPKYPVKDTDFMTDDEEKNLKRLSDLEEGLHRKRLISYGGLLKEIHKKLNLDDTEEGDLIHTDDDEKADEDGFSIIAMWNWERKNYFIKE